EYDFKGFYEKEMTMRRTFKYPPYVFLALITITDENLGKVIDVAKRFAEKLEMVLTSESIILGPTPSPLARIKKRYRSEEHTSELQSRFDLVCRLLLEKKNRYITLC